MPKWGFPTLLMTFFSFFFSFSLQKRNSDNDLVSSLLLYEGLVLIRPWLKIVSDKNILRRRFLWVQSEQMGIPGCVEREKKPRAAWFRH